MTTADWIKGRRELLDAASPAPLHFQRWGGQKNQNGDYAESILFDASGEPLVYELSDVEGELIADARSSLPLALDALEAVLAQHRPVSYAATANCGLVLYEVCPTCHDKAGVHPCGCWRDEDQIHICAECNKVWPCATAEAIETALAGGCGQCRQIDGHHKLGCRMRF